MAAVKDIANKIELGEETVTVIKIAGESCKLAALIDTGSPVSFMRRKEFSKYGKARNIKIRRTVNNLSGEPLEIIGVVQTAIIMEPLKNVEFSIEMYIIGDSPEAIILGRDFFQKTKTHNSFSPVISVRHREGYFAFMFTVM